MNRELTEIDIDKVVVKRHIREDSGDLATLENSIRSIGLLCPIVIDKDNILVSGGRRLQACKDTGMKTIQAFKLETTFDSMAALEIQSDENLCRLQLSNDDLECLIQRKKSHMGAGQRSGGGLVTRMKRMFTRTDRNN